MREERIFVLGGKMDTRRGVKCSECGETLVSFHRHDWHTCTCKATFVDGGTDYLRYGTLKPGVKGPSVVQVDLDEW